MSGKVGTRLEYCQVSIARKTNPMWEGFDKFIKKILEKHTYSILNYILNIKGIY